MRLRHATGLGRHLDIGLPSNRTAVLGTLVAGVVHGLVELVMGNGLVVFGSFVAGVLVFLAWAIAREIDPDHPGAATLAMALASPLAILGDGSALVVAVTLLAIRMIAGTTGVALMPADVAVVIASAVFAGSVPGGWVVVPVIALGASFATVGRSSVVVSAVIVGGLAATILANGGPRLGGDVLLGLATLGAVVLVETTGSRVLVSSTVDAGNRLMDARRVRLARLSAGAAAVALGFGIVGIAGPVVLAPVLASWLHARSGARAGRVLADR